MLKTKDIYIKNNLYTLYSDGRIYNPKTCNFIGSKATNGKGSCRYARINVKGTVYYIHRLIAENFLKESYFEGATVDHIDGNSNNNSVENLQWLSQSENSRKFMLEAWENGKINSDSLRGAKGKKVKVTYPTKETRIYKNMNEASKFIGIDITAAKRYYKSNNFKLKNGIEILITE